MFHRGLAYCLLAFALLFAQQGGFAHELGHVSRTSQPDKQPPHSKACEQCAAYVQVAAGAASQTIHFVPRALASACYLANDFAHSSRHFCNHLSRAPPFLV